MCWSEPEMPTVLKSQHIHSFRNVGLVRQKVTWEAWITHGGKGYDHFSNKWIDTGKIHTQNGLSPQKWQRIKKVIKLIGQHHFPGNTTYHGRFPSQELNHQGKKWFPKVRIDDHQNLLGRKWAVSQEMDLGPKSPLYQMDPHKKWINLARVLLAWQELGHLDTKQWNWQH